MPRDRIPMSCRLGRLQDKAVPTRSVRPVGDVCCPAGRSGLRRGRVCPQARSVGGKDHDRGAGACGHGAAVHRCRNRPDAAIERRPVCGATLRRARGDEIGWRHDHRYTLFDGRKTGECTRGRVRQFRRRLYDERDRRRRRAAAGEDDDGRKVAFRVCSGSTARRRHHGEWRQGQHSGVAEARARAGPVAAGQIAASFLPDKSREADAYGLLGKTRRSSGIGRTVFRWRSDPLRRWTRTPCLFRLSQRGVNRGHWRGGCRGSRLRRRRRRFAAAHRPSSRS